MTDCDDGPGAWDNDLGKSVDRSWPLQTPESELDEVPSRQKLVVDLTSDRDSQSLAGDEGSGISDSPVPFEISRSKHVYVDLPTSTLVTPKSRYAGYVPPLPPVRERVALASLMECLKSRNSETDQEFVEFELDHFTFYINSALYPYEMRPLQSMTTKISHDTFFFDGVLSVGNVRHYVTQIQVSELPIGNYASVSKHSVDDQIWVRSKMNAQTQIYYKLKKPAAEYARFHVPFLWVADLAKHVVDYCTTMTEKGREVSLSSFRKPFSQWLEKTHGKSASFQRWRCQYSSDDFCTAIHANIDFLWKEVYGVLGARKAKSLRVFREAKDLTEYEEDVSTPLPMITRGNEEEQPTIVTPYIKECFGHMIVGQVLKCPGQHAETPDTSAQVHARQGKPKRRGSIGVPPVKRRHEAQYQFLAEELVKRIQEGDTISTPRDGEGTGTKWRTVASEHSPEDHRWFGLVQKVHVSGKTGRRSFDVSWFYRPVETPCCMMKYPWPNELFLSDHCTCEEGHDARVEDDEVLGVHSVDWFGNPKASKAEFCVRQTYMIEERRWVTLDQSHMKCSHGQERLKYKAGDTVLAALSKPDTVLEPCEVVKAFKQGPTRFLRLRKLLRRNDIDSSARHAPINELVYTDEFVVTKPDKILGRCTVRFFRPEQPIPSPYNRDGTGNIFYITHRLQEDNENRARIIPFDGDFPTSLRQGFDPDRDDFEKLRGMDLFCGSGNFGRGLEDGGAIDMRWANDIWTNAVHTYMANAHNRETTHPYRGSVDDLLRKALTGEFSEKVPRPGEVDLIAAGSPCPGFSLLTPDKTTLHQVKNQSLVASFASFVDFYRPKYGILENVITIVQAHHNRTQDVLSQLFCAIVGMGYQAQLILGDAWSHGAPQSRSRVFLYFAAPGLRLPEAPLPSHSHAPGAKQRGLGEMCNGEPYVRRSFGPTAFKYVSASEGTAGLPRIDDAKADCCVPFPDHRISYGVTQKTRNQICCIPTHPHGVGFAKAWREGHGVMSPAERAEFPPKPSHRTRPNAKGWARVHPKDIFQTITTRPAPTDARSGNGLHWYDDRPLTVMEARRAQGFPDEEVLLGSPSDQWRLVGNSVSRHMSLALGLKFREAWLGSLYDKDYDPMMTTSTSTTSTSTSRATSITLPDDNSFAGKPVFSTAEDLKPFSRGRRRIHPAFLNGQRAAAAPDTSSPASLAFRTAAQSLDPSRATSESADVLTTQLTGDSDYTTATETRAFSSAGRSIVETTKVTTTATESNSNAMTGSSNRKRALSKTSLVVEIQSSSRKKKMQRIHQQEQEEQSEESKDIIATAAATPVEHRGHEGSGRWSRQSIPKGITIVRLGDTEDTDGEEEHSD
ncbi:hypothetical protein QBC46DRAFT_431654 [Diplogelasinospora grovesii]|uniref:DNA (cytosine-5-)-methyltransferase n=1 Tax=Diplogelasinospora grovesii TaxID=303347 RepID=A0AAN6NAR1_9PEZI|nr:hypothetical protein QBC46DRAFT_431654 [Diplogelasinospora grovesii]